MSDQSIVEHISALADEERRLLNDEAHAQENHARIQQIAEQLDQCWDLLRRRRARAEYGQNPDDVKVRDVRTVEGYDG